MTEANAIADQTYFRRPGKPSIPVPYSAGFLKRFGFLAGKGGKTTLRSQKEYEARVESDVKAVMDELGLV